MYNFNSVTTLTRKRGEQVRVCHFKETWGLVFSSEKVEASLTQHWPHDPCPWSCRCIAPPENTITSLHNALVTVSCGIFSFFSFKSQKQQCIKKASNVHFMLRWIRCIFFFFGGGHIFTKQTLIEFFLEVLVYLHLHSQTYKLLQVNI